MYINAYKLTYIKQAQKIRVAVKHRGFLFMPQSRYSIFSVIGFSLFCRFVTKIIYEQDVSEPIFRIYFARTAPCARLLRGRR